jgi:hypothetical protein
MEHSMFSKLAAFLASSRRRAVILGAAVLAGLVPVAVPASPVPAVAATGPGGTPAGYWLVASDGGIFSFGDAAFHGSTGAIRLNQPITGMASTPSGKGYWLVASDGGIFSFGDAGFFGSTGAIHLNKPITGMASTPSGNGYWLVASDGGIFAFGDAAFYGSTGGLRLNQPITAMATTPGGRGYWLTASDGGIFSYGDAAFFGAAPSRPATRGPRTVTAMVPTATGAGYWQASTTGELLAFGDAPDLGGVSSLNKPIVAMAALRPAGAGGRVTTPTTPGQGTPPGAGTTIVPPTSGGPQTFSATANTTWGTPPDATSATFAQNVDTFAEAGNTFFVGGEYTNLVDPNGTPSTQPLQYLAAMDVSTGAPQAGSGFNTPANAPDGPVFALAVSPDGRRLYVGGAFKNIGGHPAKNLAALDLATGAFDPTFSPPEPNAYVRAMSVANGRLYIGGAFTSLGGAARTEVAALDAQTGALVDAFNPPQDYGGFFSGHGGTPTEDPAGSPPTLGNVRDLALTGDGSMLMVGGDFLHFGTTPQADPKHQHGGLVALDPNTGALTPWQPVNSRPTFGLTAWVGDGGKTIFAAEGGAGGVVEAFRPGGSSTPVWVGHVDGDATDVVATAKKVYLVGHYDHEVPNPNDPCLQFQPQPNNGGQPGIYCPNGTPHRHLAAFDPVTGNVDPSYTAQANTPKGPNAAYMGAHNLYVGGDFTKVSDQPGNSNYRNQPGIAMYPANS